MYTKPSNYTTVVTSTTQDGKKPFVSVNAWDSISLSLLGSILGDGVGEDVLSKDVMMWWHTTIGALIDQYAKYRNRADTHIVTAENAVHALLGDSFLRTTLPQDFTVPRAHKALKALKAYKTALEWQVVSEQDVKILGQRIDLQGKDATDKIKERWAKLSVNGRRKEYVQMTIGWLTGLIEVKTRKAVELDFGGDTDEEICEFIHSLAG